MLKLGLHKKGIYIYIYIYIYIAIRAAYGSELVSHNQILFSGVPIFTNRIYRINLHLV